MKLIENKLTVGVDTGEVLAGYFMCNWMIGLEKGKYGWNALCGCWKITEYHRSRM